MVSRALYMPSSRILEFSRISDWEMLRWGLLSAPSLELEGSLPPLRCQVEAIVSSIPGRGFPVVVRVRFCIVHGESKYCLISLKTDLGSNSVTWTCINVKVTTNSTSSHLFFSAVISLALFLHFLFCTMLTSVGSSHIKHSWFQHRIVSQ